MEVARFETEMLNCVLFSFSKKISPLPFICLPVDVHHSLHINHQSVSPFSPPPGLNLFTFLSFPFLYSESRLIRRSLDLIFIKGSGEGGGGVGWLWQLFFIYRTGTKDKWLLVFCTLKKITKRSHSDFEITKGRCCFEYVSRCWDMADNRRGHIIAQLNMALGKLNITCDKKTIMWNTVFTYFRKYINYVEFI